MHSDANAHSSTNSASRKALAICLAGFAVTALALVGMTLALVPEASRSNWFWFRLAWMAFLSALCWGSVYFFRLSSLTGIALPRGAGGVTPAMAMVVIWYSVASAVLMIAQALLSGIEWVSRVHLAVQIGMGGLVAVVLLLLLIPLLQNGVRGKFQRRDEKNV